jgi:iron complex outermembrane receptor protein
MPSTPSITALALVLGFASIALPPAPVHAQAPATPGVQLDQDDDGLRIRLPVIVVRPQREEEPAQEAPVSVTAVSADTLRQAGIQSVSEAAQFAPNAFFTEFTARKLSNARFRGVGSSPANPAVTTYIDGVPQLNANSSSIELLDVDQLEFVRGPQSALFGRNTLGGLINIVSTRPSLGEWGGRIESPFGTFSTGDVRASVSGPLVENELGLGVAFGFSRRDGFTKNAVTGNDLDSRSALFTKTQLLWTPAPNWETRFLLTGERARDGDYGLNDLAALRAAPRESTRGLEGHTHRDVVAPTVQIRRTGTAVDVWSTTGVVWWEAEDLTDLDYTFVPIITRLNNERDLQFTQEFRVASAESTSVRLSDAVGLTWQGGLSFFSQKYEQDAANTYAPYVFSQFIEFPTVERTPAELTDRGLGVYGEATLTFNERLDATVGLRGDFEHKEAVLSTVFSPAIAPSAAVSGDENYSDVSPQFTIAYRVAPSRRVYATAARGFKAGGFNPAALPGSEAYGEEYSWNYEGGVKTQWLEDRLAVNVSAFYITWRDLQLNVPNPFAPGRFYIDNTAGASSRGIEIEAMTRIAPGCDIVAGFGYTDAIFDDAALSSGIDVSGNRISNTPRYTGNVGGQYTLPIRTGTEAYARADIAFRGAYYFDDVNTTEQEAYSTANFRIGVRRERLFTEFWIKNAFDTFYVPVAFPYPDLAPSGFVGESGAPRTLGARVGVSF